MSTCQPTLPFLTVIPPSLAYPLSGFPSNHPDTPYDTMSASKDYDIRIAREEALSHQETKDLVAALSSMMPAPTEEEAAASHITLPRPVVCVSYCQNPQDVAEAARQNLSVIHVPAQCQPLQRQIKEVKEKLATSRRSMSLALDSALLFGLLVVRRDLVLEVGRWIADRAPTLQHLMNFNLYHGYRTRDVLLGLFTTKLLTVSIRSTVAWFRNGADGWSHLNSYEEIPVEVGDGLEDLYLVHKDQKRRAQATSCDSPLALICHNPLTSFYYKAQGSSIPLAVYSGIVAVVLAKGIKCLYR
ncbi:hypothetical protein H4R33_000769 [Dimargaris cristalligena]|nr:hypothetical protein H4R33_000769 [Dimargaris cristalligena]